MGSRRRLADTSGERLVQAMIMFARLTGKAEQREKDKRACDQRPAKQLDVEGRHRVIPPNYACELIDLGIVPVHGSPTLPRYDTHLRIRHDEIGPERNGPEYLDEGDGHQAEVSATIGTGN